jgi:hypothetical protein
MNKTLLTARALRRVSSLTFLPLALACSGESPGTDSGEASGGAGGSSGISTSAGASSGGTATAGGSSAAGGSGNSAGQNPTGGSTSGGSGNAAGSASGGSGNIAGSASGGTGNAAGSAAGGSAGETGAGSGGSAGVTSGGASGSAGSAGTGTDPCDPASVLAPYLPADEEMAEMFVEYLAEELGAVQCPASGSGGARTISQPIFVPPNAVYDGRGETLTADAAAMNCDLTDGEQAESQRPYFLLAPGASVKNVTIDYPGCEGIHMMGDNVLENISWVNVGEDAASIRSYFPGGEILIKDSDAKTASDKIFQFNAGARVRIENFVGSDMGKLVRQNGGTEFELHVDLNNVNVTGVISAVVQSDSPLCFVRHRELVYQFTGSGDKSDRVFRDVPPENVTAY